MIAELEGFKIHLDLVKVTKFTYTLQNLNQLHIDIFLQTKRPSLSTLQDFSASNEPHTDILPYLY